MALWIRKIPCFSISLEWNGNGEILVKSGDEVIDRRDTENDHIMAGRMMRKIEEEMHETARAMCK